MALVSKTNFELTDFLSKISATVIYPAEPVMDEPVHNPTQPMQRDRLTKHNQVVAKKKKEHNNIDSRGALGGDKPWDMADGKPSH